jgi:hypothetical protein
MQKPMTQEEFEVALVRFGADMDAWPEPQKAAGRAFASAPAGAAFARSHAVMDTLLAGGAQAPLPDAGADAFLDRLLDVPASVAHPAEAASVSRRSRAQDGWAHDGRAEGGFGALLADLRAFLSPVGPVMQGAAVALLLAVGVFVGFQEPQGSLLEPQSVDLTENLFPASDDLFLEDL